MTHNTNLVQILRGHAQLQPNQLAYQFLQQGEAIGDSLSYAQLDVRARVIAAHLKQYSISAEPVLLLYPPGLEFLCAFMGCLYAGAVAVPANPPSRHQARRLKSVLEDASPKVILCDTARSLKLTQLEVAIPSLTYIPKLVSENLDQSNASDWLMPEIDGNSLAFLQYTSGSTGNPKGVMVSHDNLMANLASLDIAFQHPARAPYVSWLPQYHDMGLIGMNLRALYTGSPIILMSPTAFIEKPIRWLRAISEHKAYYSGGPNFAYHLCANKIRPEQCEGLDLSHWGIAFNGAEPIRANTLIQFAKAFEPFGFSKQAFRPCYGMAETTLFISSNNDHSTQIKCFDSDALSQQQVSLSDQQTDQGTLFVSCGTAQLGEKFIIVNPDMRYPCANNEIGEIWVQGSSVAKGYWNKPQLTQQMFKAELSDRDRGHFLRTGDLGFIHQDQLYYAGRLKDLIIIRGVNIYPQDLEQVIDEQVESVRAGCSAVFSFDNKDEEAVVIVCELTRQTYKLSKKSQQVIAEQIRQVLSQSFSIQLWAVVLVAPATVPKTSSGKIMRSACKRQWLKGQLRIALEDKPQKERQNSEPVNQEHVLFRQMLDQSNSVQKHILLLQFLRVHLATALRCTAEQINGDISLVEMGLDSLGSAQLKHALDTLLQQDIPLSYLMGDLSLKDLAEKLTEQKNRLTAPAGLSMNAPQTDKMPLSEGQKAIWFVHQQQAQSIAYNIHLALRIPSEVDSELLQKSLNVIMNHHPALRTAYGENAGIPYQTISKEVTDFFALIDTKNWTDETIQQTIYSMISTPFDLEAGEVLRVRLLIQDDSSSVLLLCAHHIALDFWSLSLIVQQLGDLYLAGTGRSHFPQIDSGAPYADFVRWQQIMLAHDAGSHWQYWSQQLSGDLTQLSLPTDSPRPKQQNFLGASQALDISATATASLKAFSQQHQTTLFVTLLSAFSALLYRYSGQQDMLIGIPTSGRTQKKFANTIGYFVNPVAMRFKPDGALPFHQLIEQTRANMLEAMEHQDYPFSAVVKRLNPEREADSWPLYQLAFTLQTSQMAGQQDLAGLALGELGFSMRWGGFDVESFAVNRRIENFDLKLIMAETSEGLSASFQFNSELFEVDTIRTMADHFRQLLKSIVEQPEQALCDLKMLSIDEHRQQLANKPQDKPVHSDCVHKEFEYQAQTQPQALAIQSADTSLSYRQLDERSNQLARCLQVAGACPESIVALCLPRGTDFVVAMLAILKTGAVYLPLDSSLPSARIRDMLADAGALAIISCEEFNQNSEVDCQTILLDRDKIMIDTYPITSISTQLKLENTAYLIYTSGSSGKPKGVSVSHRALINLVSWHQQEYQLSSNDRASQIAGLGFDASVWEIWPYLSAGASLHIVDDKIRLNPDSILNWLKQQQISHCFLPTPLAELVLQASWPKNMALKALLTGGDRLGKITDKQQAVSLYNHYGPTENAVVASFTKIDWQDKHLPPIGHAIDNVRLYILDASLNPVPRGCEGDLYIAGSSLARGYHHRPSLTAECFIPNPFSDIPGTRMYISGDRARYRKDGKIEFCGRNDQQIKVRGFRIEPAEIEYQLEQIQGIKTSSVLMQTNGINGQQLTAYIVPAENHLSFIEATGEVESADILRTTLNQHLPDYMVPQAFVFLDKMPINANGKLDRNNLPLPGASLSGSQHIEAITPTEHILINIWQQLLGVASIGIRDNFFELGGDSILSIQVVSRARSKGIVINSRHIFEHQTVEKLAEKIDRLTQQEIPRSEEQHNALATLYSTEQRKDLTERFGDIDAVYPLTPLQMGLWFQNQFDTEQSVYIEQLSLLLQGSLNVDALRSAWRFVQTRHEVLRTAFDWLDAEQAVQIVVKGEQLELPFYQMDWRNFNAKDQQAQLKSFLAQDYLQGFNSSQAPLMRISLIRITDQQCHMVWTHHHLLLDGWSIPILLAEVFEAYQHFCLNQTPDFPQPPAYSHYINWLAQRDQTIAQQYWQKALSGFDEPLFLQDPRIENTDSNSQPMQRSDFVWDKQFTEQLQTFCSHQHITLNTLLQGAWALLLNSHTARNDVLFGIVDAGRQHALEGIENMVGLLINSLPLRIKLNAERPADEWLQELQIQTLELGEYSYSPLPDIQRWSDCDAQTPLFDILMAFENYPLSGIKDKQYADLSIANVSHQDQTHYALTLVIKPAESLSFSMSYDSQRFNASGIKILAQHFKTLVAELMANPQQQLAKFSPVDKREQAMLEGFSQVKSSHPVEKTIVECFQQQVSLRANTPALIFENQTLSYQALETQANQLAQAISQQGIQAGDRVALSLERSIHSVVAIVAVLKAGATYVPLDPHYPEQRQTYTIKDASVRLLIVDKKLSWHQELAIAVLALDTLDFEQFTDQAPIVNIDPQWPAYIIYTSGSTGKPKGVCVSHAQVMRLFTACAEHVDFKPTDVWTLFHSFAFDFSVWELWGALLHGASCVVVPYWVSRSAKDFQQLIQQQKVTILSQTPSAFYQLQKQIISQKSAALNLRYIVFGGEALDPARLDPWFAQFSDNNAQLINMYGITETTVHVTARRLYQHDCNTSLSNIGKPLNDLSTWVLDGLLQAVPVGVIGELYVGGTGVSQGYIGRASLSAERFIPDPFSKKAGARLYRTGDLVRYCEDGTLEYHGRCDKQVKLHGHRIETGEIEHALLQHPAVESTAVIIAHNEQQASAQLIAYWVGEQTDNALLKAELEQQLPSYMVPQHIIHLDALPLTINGKLDYQALPAPDQPVLTENVSAETEVESQLLSIWCELLKVEKIGISDNFFALGGDSILSMQVVNRAQQQGIKITPKQLFEHQDIRSLARVAEYIETNQITVSTKMSGIVPFTPIQHWFFEQPLKNFNHWNQTLLLAMPQARDADILQRALVAVTEHHHSFRLRYSQQQGHWHQAYQEKAESVSFEIIDLTDLDKFQQQQMMVKQCQSAQQMLDIEHGPVFRALYFRCAPLQSNQLLLCAHHLIVDGVSWRIILEDMELAYQQLSNHSEIALPQKTHSFEQWSEQLIAYTAGESLQKQRNYWLNLPWASITALESDQPLADNIEDGQAIIQGQLSTQETQDLLKKIPAVYGTQINDLLLTALAKCLLAETHGSVVHIDIEGHGREPLFDDLDISNTVGWFTSQYPVLLSLSGLGMGEDIKRVKELLRAIPQQGIGFGLLRHLDKTDNREQFANLPKASLCFNYLGQFDASWANSSPLFASPDSVASQIGNQHAGNNPRYYDIDINIIVVGGELIIHWTYSPRHSKQRIEKLANSYLQALRDLIAHCLSPTAGGFSPSDFPLADQLDQQALDQLLNGL